MNYFDEQEMSSFETSHEIMEAISEVSKSKTMAELIWQEPGQFYNETMVRAWALAEDDVAELHWGAETICRDIKK